TAPTSCPVTSAVTCWPNSPASSRPTPSASRLTVAILPPAWSIHTHTPLISLSPQTAGQPVSLPFPAAYPLLGFPRWYRAAAARKYWTSQRGLRQRQQRLPPHPGRRLTTQEFRPG